MAKKVNMEYVNFEAKLSFNNPLGDYAKLMNDKMKADVVMPQEVYNACWKKISAAAREIIWKILFDEQNPQDEQLEKAADLLKIHKEDACFYQAAEYNEWIVLVRDELLKRKMFDFWKNVIVKNELGLCWSRDSDLFDDPEDPEPANFYKYADCEAPWLKKKIRTVADNAAGMAASALFSTDTPSSDKPLRKLSMDNPVEDYKYNMEAQGENSDDDDDVYKQIFSDAREKVWYLLFNESTLTTENYKKAAELLEEYKRDACFYSPWEYNEWIPKVKDELLKRKYLNFWQDVVVKNELGLCWARDSDYFDDMEDPVPLQFYKVEEELMKKQKK